MKGKVWPGGWKHVEGISLKADISKDSGPEMCPKCVCPSLKLLDLRRKGLHGPGRVWNLK